MERRIFSIHLVLAAILFILVMPLALAYPVTMQLNGNMQFNTAIYHCFDSTCLSIGSLYASDSGNPVSYTINNEGSGTQYFAEYDYVADRCYASQTYVNWFDEYTGAGPWEYDVNFEKEEDCKAEINSLSFDSQMLDNQVQEITVNIQSPFNLNQEGPQVIPTELEYYYSTNVNVDLKIKSSSATVYQETKDKDIKWGTNNNLVFSVPAYTLETGTYTVEARTYIDDCVCQSYIEQIRQGSLSVIAPPDTTPPSITNLPSLPSQNTKGDNIPITFDSSEYPLDITFLLYDQENLVDTQGPVQINSQAELPIYYTVPNLADGTYTLKMQARDAAGNIATITLGTITITTPPLPPEPDTTPPSISITSPTETTYTTSDVLVEISASDPNLESVWFSDGTNTYTYTVPVTITFADGLNQISAWANDTAGNTNSVNVFFSVDTSTTDEEEEEIEEEEIPEEQPEEEPEEEPEEDEEDEEDEQEDEEEKKEIKIKSKKVNLEIKDIEKQTVSCGRMAKISFRIENSGDGREDVLVNIKSSELEIDQSRIITLDEKEEELINFYINIPLGVKDKLYYLDITTESRGKIIEELFPLRVNCEAEKIIVMAQSTTLGSFQKEKTTSAETGGITGNVIAAIEGLGNPVITVLILGILNLLIVLSIIFLNRR